MGPGAPKGRAAHGAAAWIVAIAILVASLANGAYGYLARLGVLDRAQYQQIVDTYCLEPRSITGPLALSCRCMQIHQGVDYSVAPWPDYIYRTDGYRFALKFAKDALFAALLAVSLFALRQWRPGPQVIRGSWPLLLFGALLAVGSARTIFAGNPLFAVLGARPFEFIAIAATAAWLSPQLGSMSRPLAWLLYAQAALVGLEMLFGIPMRSCPNSFRAAGTMVQPNSLGIMTAVLMAFVASVRPRLAMNPWLWLVAILVLVASGSGAGMLLLFLLACWLGVQRVPATRRFVATGVAFALTAMLLLALPTLTQRPQIFDTIFGVDGRIDKALTVLRSGDATTMFVGSGIGPGSNSSVNLASAQSAPVREAFSSVEVFYPDSTITMLLRPLGILGALAWLLLLAWGFRRDRRARPFYLIAACASLVINLPELFPANLLLGLVLAHTLVRTGALRRARP